MSEFPLYDTLTEKLPKKDLTKKQREEFLSLSNTLDSQTTEYIYVLIKTHQQREESQGFVPYNGNYQNSDVNFDLSEIPISLKHILLRFLKKQNEINS